MFIIGRSTGYRSDFCKLARTAALKAVRADPRSAGRHAESSAESAGSAETSQNPGESAANRPSDFDAKTCRNLPKPLPGNAPPRERTGVARGVSQKCRKCRNSKSPENWPSDGTVAEMPKTAVNAENHAAVCLHDSAQDGCLLPYSM
jgi:hypothetical protein